MPPECRGELGCIHVISALDFAVVKTQKCLARLEAS